MIAWYSPARSSLSSWIIRSRVMLSSLVMFSLVINIQDLFTDFHAWMRSGFHGEPDFDGHLPVIHLPLVDVAACFDHLEPAQVLDGLVRALNGLINGVLDGRGRGAGEFDEFIDVIFHVRFSRYSGIHRLGYPLTCSRTWSRIP